MSRFRSSILLIAILVAIAAGVLYKYSGVGRQATPRERRNAPDSVTAANPIVGSIQPVHYVGSDTCIECHREQHESYLQTAHSRSMTNLDLKNEAAGTTFDHALSNRSYATVHANGQLEHREWLGFGQNPERVLLHDSPIRYAVGSGRFAKSYLTSVEGFLVQSPITWYETKQQWGMSPGYDAPLHRSFQRAITSGCLFCHSGHVEQVNSNPFRLQVEEVAIGCERCHGPGSTHVQRQRSTDVRDITEGEIVNPAHLSRDLAEAVCQQCHLQGEAQIARQGKRIEDYRPGLPLSDFRYDFNLHKTGSSMTVVGHVEQLHMSACYQASTTLTCVTCHDPHHDGEPRERVAAYRAACLKCHAEEACSIASDVRRERQDDNCTACHMPQSPTEVPHIAFTHHRIGIHGSGTPDTTTVQAGAIIPFQDLSEEPEVATVRAFGLAHLHVFRRYGNMPEYRHHLVEAERLLQQAHSSISDPVVLSELAKLALERRDWAQADALSSLVLETVKVPTEPRLDALAALGQARFQQHRFREAVDIYRELTVNRYNAQDWYFLGLCEQNCDLTAQAIQDLQHAMRIDPSQLGAMDALTAILQSIGETQDAESLRNQSGQVRRLQANGN